MPIENNNWDVKTYMNKLEFQFLYIVRNIVQIQNSKLWLHLETSIYQILVTLVTL
jgi:hypothetical protein